MHDSELFQIQVEIVSQVYAVCKPVWFEHCCDLYRQAETHVMCCLVVRLTNDNASELYDAVHSSREACHNLMFPSMDKETNRPGQSEGAARSITVFECPTAST